MGISVLSQVHRQMVCAIVYGRAASKKRKRAAGAVVEERVND